MSSVSFQATISATATSRLEKVICSVGSDPDGNTVIIHQRKG